MTAGRLEDLAQALERVSRWIALIALCGLIGLSLLVMTDVLLRWLFGAPIQGTVDINQILLPVIIVACFPVAIMRKQHIAIRFLGHALGPRPSAWLESFGSLMLLAFFALMAWQFVDYAIGLGRFDEHSWILKWRLAPWWWATAILMISCLPLQLLMVVRQLARAVGPDPGEIEPASSGFGAGDEDSRKRGRLTS